MLFTAAESVFSFNSGSRETAPPSGQSQNSTVLNRSDWERKDTKPYDYNGCGFKCSSCLLKHVFAGRNRRKCSVHLLKILSCRSLLRTERRGCTRCSNKCLSFLSDVTSCRYYSCCWWFCGYWPLGGKDPSIRLSDDPVLDCSLLQQKTQTELKKFPVTVVRKSHFIFILYPNSSCT